MEKGQSIYINCEDYCIQMGMLEIDNQNRFAEEIGIH
jgi:hypothetical protein